MKENYWLGKVEDFASSQHIVKLIKSSFYNEKETKLALVDFIMNTDRLSMGEECLKFETAFSKSQKRDFSVFVSSGSMANLLLLQALMNLGRLKHGDKVGFSALTWPTNVMPIIQLGLVPVPLDCSPKTLNVTPDHLQEVADDIACLFLTNVLGFSDDIKKISKICKSKGIIFIEDNCESLGSTVGDTLLGNFGLASTFSFFVGHHMSTIEGGMICTNDEELNRALVMARAHGWDRNLSPKEQAKLRDKHNIDDFYARYTFYDLAYNARPTEINGFLGNVQIKYLDEIVKKREANFKTFLAAIKKNNDFVAFDLSHMSRVSNFAMPVTFHDPKTSQHYKKRFLDAKVEIRPIIAGNVTRQPFYQKYSQKVASYPNSDAAHLNGFYFGNNAEMSPVEIDLLCKLLEK